MKYRLFLLCIIQALVFQTFAQDFTGSLPHIPVICISRFNPESARGKHIFENLKNLGADALLIPESGWNSGTFPTGLASIINITPSDSSNAFDITRYVDAAYSVWEAEGTPFAGTNLKIAVNPQIGIAIPDSGYVRSRGTTPGLLIRGPGYRQKMVYDSYGEPTHSQMVYSASFFLKFEKSSLVKLDSHVVLGELQVAVRNQKYPDSLLIMDQRQLTYGDILRAETDGWFVMHLIYHYSSLFPDENSTHDPESNELPFLIEFPVFWQNIPGTTLYIDKVVVSEPRGFSLAHDPMVREYFVDIFREQRNAHLLDKWFAMPKPSFADSQFPYRVIDSLANLAMELRDGDRKSEINPSISSILYLNLREQESGSVIESALYPEAGVVFPKYSSGNFDATSTRQMINAVHTGLLYGASQVWIDSGLLVGEGNDFGSTDSASQHESALMMFMQEKIIPRLKGEFGRTMKLLKNPIITTRKKIDAGGMLQLGEGVSAYSKGESVIEFGVYLNDTVGCGSFLYAVNGSDTPNEYGDSLIFSFPRNHEPYQNYLIRNIITGETETVPKNQTGDVKFVAAVPAGDARLFEIVPAATRKGKRSLVFDETMFHDLIINKEDTLLIHAGVRLTMLNGTSIRNIGTLIVQGSQDSVRIDFVNHSGNNGIYNNGTLLIDGCSMSNGVYGVVHHSGTLDLANSVISGCGTGLLLHGSEVSPRIAKLSDCLLTNNGFGIFVANSTVSLNDVVTNQNGTGIAVFENSVLLSDNALQQVSFDNVATDLSVSRSLLYFKESVSDSGRKLTLSIEKNSLLINGEQGKKSNEKPLSMVLKAMQLAISGDTTVAVRICNELWGEYPESELAAISLLVVKYVSSRQVLHQFPVFLDVLAGSSFSSPLRLASDMIKSSGSFSELEALELRYNEPEYREALLFALFRHAILSHQQESVVESILSKMQSEFSASTLTQAAKLMYSMQKSR